MYGCVFHLIWVLSVGAVRWPWALPKTQRSFALTLRVVAVFALAKADLVFDAVPVQADDLLEFQRQSDVPP